MKLNQFDFNLRPETTLGQVWETVRQWILNSPYSKFGKVPRKLPTKISEGEDTYEAEGDEVTLSRVGDGMEVVSTRVRKALKWRTIMTFTRQKKAVKCRVQVMLDGTIPENVPVELKVPRIVKQLMKTYGLQLEERVGVGEKRKEVEEKGKRKSRSIEVEIRPKRKKTTSKSKDWNQTMAAKLLGISTRQLRNYAKNPPDGDWPGWEDPILLRQWKNKRDDRDKMNQALARSLGYKEGYSEAFRRKRS